MAFKYVPRSGEAVKQRAKDKGSSFDRPIKSEIPVWTPKEGKNKIRLIPWSNDPKRLGLGYDIFVHSGVGPDNGTYLCLAKMKKQECPVCEERADAAGDDEEYAKQLRAYKRVVCWIVDRNAEDEGPQLFLMGGKMEGELNELSQTEDGEILQIDDPFEGYDIEFTRQGKGQKTQYTGTKIARRSTPLTESEKRTDKWLRFCMEEHPIEECLRYYESEYVEGLLHGKSSKSDSEDERPRTRSESKRGRDEDEEDEKPARRRVEDDDEEERPKRRRDEDEEDEKRSDPPRRGRDTEDEDGPRPKKTSRSEDEDEEPPFDKPKTRRSSDDDDEDEKPTKKPRDEDEDEEDEKPKSSLKDRVQEGRKKADADED